MLDFPQAGRPRRRNAIASGIISLLSITPAKIAYAATGDFFLMEGGYPRLKVGGWKMEDRDGWRSEV